MRTAAQFATVLTEQISARTPRIKSDHTIHDKARDPTQHTYHTGRINTEQTAIGAYGNADVQTPHIDSLAHDGVRYANSFCTYPCALRRAIRSYRASTCLQHLGGSNHCTLPSGWTLFRAYCAMPAIALKPWERCTSPQPTPTWGI